MYYLHMIMWANGKSHHFGNLQNTPAVHDPDILAYALGRFDPFQRHG